jgi:hypothetical protein
MSDTAIIEILSTIATILCGVVLYSLKNNAKTNLRISDIDIRVAENTTEIVNIKREINEHKVSNNTSFENVDKVYQEFITMSKTIVANSEKIANILKDMEEHKCNNDKSFVSIIELVKEYRTDNKGDHEKMFKLIGDGQNKLTELLISKIN